MIKFESSDIKLTPMERASAAKQILGNSVFMEAVSELRREIMDLWEKTGVNQVEEREFCFVFGKALSRLVVRLEGYVNEAILEDRIREEREKVE